MDGYDAGTAYGPAVASGYDEAAIEGNEEVACGLLAEVVGQGRALEFAIGTGRIALRLAELGIEVAGIEISPHMVDRLRSKAGGSTMEVKVGDMASTVMPGTFSLVYLVANTIFNLQTQDDQVRCFENAAHHLDEEGAFVVETVVPSAWTKEHDYVRPRWVEPDGVGINVCHYDPVSQVLEENHVRLSAKRVRAGGAAYRLASPSELDLMARIAGLRLAERWGGWHREPFTADSTKHVSVYRRT